jgi:iron(III) transport system ATP-binding protein
VSSALRICDLHKSFGSTPVLSGVDLEVRSGSFTALLGPSGAGKTTLLRLLAGFERPDRGTIEIGGQLVASPQRQLRPERRRIGYVPQEGSLFPHLTVAGNVGFGLPRARRGATVARLLELVGIPQLARRYPHQLSGGQQQRVALARALAIDPQVVLLDEPFSSLDVQLRAGLREEVRGILARAGATTLLVTHNQDEALSVADSVAVLRDGRIAQHATPQELYCAPADRALASFVGRANLLDGVAGDGLVETPLGLLRLRPGGPTSGGSHGPGGEVALCGAVDVLVRPEQIRVRFPAAASPTTGACEDAPGGRRSAAGGGERWIGGSERWIPGRVLWRRYHGHDTLLGVELLAAPGSSPCAQPPVVSVRMLGAGAPEPGQTVELTVAGDAIAWPDAQRPQAEGAKAAASVARAVP